MINAQILTEGEGIPSDMTGLFLRLNWKWILLTFRTSALTDLLKTGKSVMPAIGASQLSCLALCLSPWSLSWAPKALLQALRVLLPWLLFLLQHCALLSTLLRILRLSPKHH